jgi:hypothetical protein
MNSTAKMFTTCQQHMPSQSNNAVLCLIPFAEHCEWLPARAARLLAHLWQPLGD